MKAGFASTRRINRGRGAKLSAKTDIPNLFVAAQ
jgi:hypothetical protein